MTSKEQHSQKPRLGAELVVDVLEKQGVTHIFGIPGAKIDRVFDVLQERGPELVLCRHEQNAAFMAAAVGRLTGRAGVCLVTSGPGASNLATGLVTATAEGDPVVAISGAVTRKERLKRTHQSMDNAALFQPITKYSAEVQDPDNVPEALVNAFRAAESPRQGAAFVSFPQDIIQAETEVRAPKALHAPKLGVAQQADVTRVVELLRKAKMPVILLGMGASKPEVTESLRRLLKHSPIPVVETFQAAGAISRELEDCFYGRVGLFRNQPGDDVLHLADVVLAVGYDPVEYDPKYWNAAGERTIIHLDDTRAEIDHDYQPELEMLADMSATLDAITGQLDHVNIEEPYVQQLAVILDKYKRAGLPPEEAASGRIHPLQVIQDMRSIIPDDVTVTCDVGSHYIWMARYFRSYEPRRLLFSNGMQTLGVALPWGIAAALVEPGKKVVSVSGDGGFLFSAMELETAVRLRTPIVHLVWNDGSYDMVAFQQQMKYERTSGVQFGPVDLVKYAESFGAVGMRLERPEDFPSLLQKAMQEEGPVLIDIPIDYADNIALGESLLPNQFH